MNCLYIIYSSGLRVGEAVRLQKMDIDPERKTLHIRQGKGRKDRYTLLSDTAFEVVKHYSQSGLAGEGQWLFPGQSPEDHLTERTVQKVFKQAVRNVK
ncbi:tyrosine-type recombinase/integrase [Cohnella thailandensis]|uniref:tyrosine-type recombinase/integrase n=1 Tax=Cohnella thailandensis TaxID=557557 RepID=UPI001DCC159B|nr:tyrosine-type recombinase/integrase [Cohnella thailandensis]MBP1974679.1 site-specific recombinase XerD [Cohnella thailandensis]